MKFTYIKSLELTYRGDSEEIKDLTRRCKMMNVGGVYTCLDHAEKGVIMKKMKCKNKYKGNRKIVIMAYPIKLIDEDPSCERTISEIDFVEVYQRLDELIQQIMPGLTVSDFKLNRMVIARKMLNIPKHIGREYIMIMRKMSLKDPFTINTKQKDCNSGLGCEDYFSAVDDKGVEFAVYNERCETADRNYSEDAENMMRIELQCSKGLIHDLTKGLDTMKAVLLMSRSANKILNNFYARVFKYGTDLCYISRDRQKRLIKKKYNDKAVRKELLEIIKEMRCSNVDLDMVLCEHYYNRSKKDMMMEFTEMGFSPIPIRSDRFSFISPLDFVLGFCNEYKYQGLKENACYNEIKHSIDSEKEMFDYDPFRSSNQIVLPEVNQVKSE